MIHNSSEAGDCGKIHVDYAVALEDQSEYQSRNLPDSVQTYSEHEARLLADRLKGKRDLVAWPSVRSTKSVEI